jgi:ubiquinol-cytochrome c reductase cytochrome c subunit
VDVPGHVHPSVAFLNLDLVAPVALVATAALVSRTRHALLLLACAAVLLAAALPPLHGIAEASVTGHMVQHLLLIVVAAPLLGVVLAEAPTRLRGIPPLRAVSHALVTSPYAPLVAGAVHAAAVVTWHVPSAYDAAVDIWWVHGLEHLIMFGTGAWWWSTVAHHTARRAVGSAVVSLFGVATAGAAMGVLLMFAPSPLYGQGGLQDQQIAGALMAGGTGFVYGGTALMLVARAVQRLSAPRPMRVPTPLTSSRGAARLAPVGLCVLATAAGLVLWGPGEHGHAAANPSQAPPAVDDADQDDDASGTEIDGGNDDTLGRDLYRRDCASCHGPDGAGSFRGTSLAEVGTASVSYVLTTGRMPISDPDDAIRRGTPAYDDDEIEALVDYVETLIEGPSPPELDLAAADPARGGEHYRLQCAACHGAEGIGGALAIEGFAPSVLHSTPQEVANVMVSGPGVMPAFAATYDDGDLADIAAYVLVLQDRPGTATSVPGGRVGEGLVAWLAVLGVLVLGARWIGGSA